MAALKIAQTQRDSAVSANTVATIPHPAKVRASAAEIRRGWSAHERIRRAAIARSMCLKHLVARLVESPQVPDARPVPQATLRPRCRPSH